MSYGEIKPLMNSDAATDQIRRVTLEKQSEIRIHVGRVSPLKLRVLDGIVEIFGTELPPKVWLTFPLRLQLAVFTWDGATIEIDGVTKFDTSNKEITLINDLKESFKFKKNLQILNLDKSAGVFCRDSDFRKTVRNNNIQKYFYGATNDLTVYTKTAKFSDVQVYQIGDLRDKSALQRRSINDPLRITPVKIDKDLVNKVLQYHTPNSLTRSSQALLLDLFVSKMLILVKRALHIPLRQLLNCLARY